MSVRQLAGKLDVATQVVYDWQNGKNAVSDENAARLAELWGMSEVAVRRNLGLWVPGDTPEPDADEDVLEYRRDIVRRQVQAAIEHLSPADQTAVLERMIEKAKQRQRQGREDEGLAGAG